MPIDLILDYLYRNMILEMRYAYRIIPNNYFRQSLSFNHHTGKQLN